MHRAWALNWELALRISKYPAGLLDDLIRCKKHWYFTEVGCLGYRQCFPKTSEDLFLKSVSQHNNRPGGELSGL